jgi:hypothetical protein
MYCASGKAACMLNIRTFLTWVVSFTFRSLYFRTRASSTDNTKVLKWGIAAPEKCRILESCRSFKLLNCIINVGKVRPPQWSSGQGCWLQIQRSVFHSQRYHIFWEVVGLERGPLSLVTTTEELLGRNSSGSGLEKRD